MPCDESPFSVSVVHQDGSLLLALAGDLDIATGPVLRRTVADLISPHLRAVTVDLASLNFVDVAGLRAFLDVKEMVTGVHAEFQLTSVGNRTRRVIRLADFDKLESVIEADSAASA